MNFCDIRKYEISRIYMDFLSFEGSDKLVKRSDFCLLIILGKCVIFQLEKKCVNGH